LIGQNIPITAADDYFYFGPAAQALGRVLRQAQWMGGVAPPSSSSLAAEAVAVAAPVVLDILNPY
jgi:hypothetical protein